MSTSTASLGSKYACSQCGIRYYGLGREDVRCPRCGAPPEPIGQLGIAARKKAGGKKGRRDDMYEPRLVEDVDEEFTDEEADFDEAAFDEDLDGDLGDDDLLDEDVDEEEDE